MKSKALLYLIVCTTLVFTGCGKKEMTADEMARKVFQCIRDNDMKELVSMGVTDEEFIVIREKREPRFRSRPEEEQKQFVEERQQRQRVSIEEDGKDVRRAFCNRGEDWEKAIFTRSFHKIINVEYTDYTTILVSFEYNRKLEYFEVDCVRTKNGWKILGDISSHISNEANEKFIESLHPVPPSNSQSSDTLKASDK